MPRRRTWALPVVALTAAALTLPAGAAAVPSNVGVTQEGLAFRVSWTPDPGFDAHAVDISTGPDFGAAGSANCREVAGGGGVTVVMRCLIPFAATVHVRVQPLAAGGEAAVVQVPLAAFTFAPVPAPAVVRQIGVRNRQRFRCAAPARVWSNVDAGTAFSGRITAGGIERAAGPIVNPFATAGPPPAVEYAVRGADVGRPIRCEVTAANGAFASTRTVQTRVGHARPREMRPAEMLTELPLPPSFGFDGAVRSVPVGRADRRAGVLARAARHSEGPTVFVTYEIDSRLAIFATPALADAQVRVRRFCRDLRRGFARRFDRGVLACGPARIPNARRALRATTFGSARRADGVQIVVVQSVVLASAGNATFTLDARVGDRLSLRARAGRIATRATARVGADLALAAKRE